MANLASNLYLKKFVYSSLAPIFHRYATDYTLLWNILDIIFLDSIAEIRSTLSSREISSLHRTDGLVNFYLCPAGIRNI